jgi:hypothetical protein
MSNSFKHKIKIRRLHFLLLKFHAAIYREGGLLIPLFDDVSTYVFIQHRVGF